MASIKPFKAIRPSRDKAHLVATRSYVSYKRRILNAILETNPYSFLHIIRPEYGQKVKTRPNTRERFKNVRKKFEEFCADGTFVQDQKENLYIYRQIKDGFSYTGIIAGASIDDYFNQVIKVHEHTLTKREQVFKEYLNICEFNAEPVLFTYPDHNVVNAIVEKHTHNRAEIDFSTTDRVRHSLWIIDDESAISQITKEFESISSVYIADGHHRTASSALYGREQEEAGNNNPLHHYFMAYFIPESQLNIYDFNRVVKDLNGLTKEQFIQKLNQHFIIEVREQQYSPTKIHNFSMYLIDRWYSLTVRDEAFNHDDPVGKLDAHILSEKVLAPILGITDLKNDRRVDFVGGLEGMNGLQQQVDSGKMEVAFGLYPVSVSQLKEVADTNNIMPPKTTWIEPKMRSGLTIYSLSN